MVSGPPRVKGDGNGLFKAVENQIPAGAHLNPKGGLRPSPENLPLPLPGSHETAFPERAGPPMVAGSAAFPGFTLIV